MQARFGVDGIYKLDLSNYIPHVLIDMPSTHARPGALSMNVIKFEILYIFGELLFALRTTKVTARRSIKRMNVTRHRRGKIVIYMSCHVFILRDNRRQSQ